MRRMNGNETADDFRTAVRLAFYDDRRKKGKSAYVMVQRGFPNFCMQVGGQKRELKNNPISVALKKQSFKQWAKSIQEYAKSN